MKPALPLPITLALLLLYLAARSATEAPSPLPVQCPVKLAALSSCLPHLAALPENATFTPSAACCQAFAAAIDGAGGGASCLCDLVRRPFLLGSWLDASRLVALLSSCGKSVSVEVSSFAKLCQGQQPKPLEPLQLESEPNATTDVPPLEFEPKLEQALEANASSSADDYEAEPGSMDPDRRGRRRPLKPPRPSPSPRRPSPTPGIPPPGSGSAPEAPPPPPASGKGRLPCIPIVPTIPEDSAGCRMEKLFWGTVLFLLSIFALC